MEITEQSRTLEHRCDGVTVARMSISLPQINDCGEISEFYGRLGGELEKWFRTRACPAAERAYELSQDERKRWRCRPSVLRVGFAEQERGGGNLLLSVNVFFAPFEGSPVQRTRVHLWNTAEQRLVPHLRAAGKQERSKS